MIETEVLLDRDALVGAVSHVLVGRKHSPRMVQAAVDGVLAAVEANGSEDPERGVREYYLAVTGAEPYTRPGMRCQRLRAREILATRDALFGREPRLRYVYWEAGGDESPFDGLLAEYAEWMRGLGKSDATVDSRLRRANVLLGWLAGRDITDLSGLDARTLAEFVASLDGCADATRANVLYAVRNLLLSFPVASEALSFNPAGLLSGLHIPKDATLPSVYSASEVSAALAAIDRDTDAGKAIYLAVALAATYGLRGGDIIRLTIDDVDFAHGRITLRQHKTGKPVELPLVEGVRLPLLDYLANARRDCECREVLIRLRGEAAPYAGPGMFSKGLRRALADAGVDTSGRRAGLHAMRHSLATSMHSDGVPATDIGDVLGHSSPMSTRTYLRSDVGTLRLASLEVV